MTHPLAQLLMPEHLVPACLPAGLRALIYSGDMDMAVPHPGSEAWTAAMHKSSSLECQGVDSSNDAQLVATCDGVINQWQPWYNSKSPKQVRCVTHGVGRREQPPLHHHCLGSGLC